MMTNPSITRFYRMLLMLPTMAAASSTGICSEESTTPPNILMIAIDDFNDWASALAGHPQAATPNIDRLAASGVLFTNAHCQAPLCGPSRASIFTGLNPSTTGIYLHVDDDKVKLANEAAYRSTFLTDYFEEHGYRTMGAGKLLHQGAGGDLLQEFAGHNSFGPHPEKPMRYDSPQTATDWGAFPETDEEMPDHKVADYGISQLSRTHDKPFFLALGFNRPHVPWHVPKKWFDRFPTDELAMPPFLTGDLDDVPEISRIIHDMPSTPTTTWLIEQDYWKEVVQAYLACVAFVDHEVGRVLDALRHSPHADNTIIVLWSDHGYHLGEKNIVAKMTLWEESSHVPLVFAGRGVSCGSISGKPVGLIDIYPTLVELADLPAGQNLDGRSLVPLLKDPEASWEGAALTFWGRNNTAVRTEQFRYILYEDGSEELYDRKADPNEWNNLAGNPTFRKVKATLREHIPSPQAPLTNVSGFRWNAYWREKTEAAKDNIFDPDQNPSLP